jgi:OmpA-OmpF porin, OOP family
MKLPHKILLVWLLSLPFLIQAQKTEIGLFAGNANYQGDLAEGEIRFEETQIGYGGFFRYHIHPKIGVKFNVYSGTLSGNDANNSKLKSRGFEFKTNFTELSINFEWSPFPRKKYDAGGEFMSARFVPYVSAGVGTTLLNKITGADNNIADGKVVIPEEGTPASLICVPVGGGFKFFISDRLTVGIEGGYRTVFSDYLDGISKNANPTRNDWYIVGGVTVSYLIGEIERYNFGSK